MTAQLDPERVLALAKESPARVGQHDKAGWLALFCAQAAVEDPVGSAPHQREAGAADPLEKFYDVFIAPNDIAMTSSLDVVAGHQVARDVVINTRLPHNAKTDVAAYLLYDIVQEDGQLRLARIGAHWEVARLSWQVMSSGLSGLLAMNSITLRMLRIEGLSGLIGYMRGMVSGIGRQGTRTLEKFAAAVRSRDAQALCELFTDQDAAIEFPIGQTSSPADFLSRLPAGTEWSFERPQNSGFVTACRFSLSGDVPRPGIAFFHFDAKSRRIERARLFVAT